MLNIPQYSRQHLTTRIIQSKMSIVPRLRNFSRAIDNIQVAERTSNHLSFFHTGYQRVPIVLAHVAPQDFLLAVSMKSVWHRTLVRLETGWVWQMAFSLKPFKSTLHCSWNTQTSSSSSKCTNFELVKNLSAQNLSSHFHKL